MQRASGSPPPSAAAPTSPAQSGEVGRRPGAGLYIGRFAPSPTGPLHFGSLVAAVGSYVDARAHGGRWLLRIEDLDPPRERPGATDAILGTLDRLGLHWDGPIMRQGERTAAYAAALGRLSRRNLLHACGCTRATLQSLTRPVAATPQSPDEPYHPPGCPSPRPGAAAVPGLAWRLRVPRGLVTFDDRSLGPQSVDVAATVGNFVLRRRDGLFAYQLAVVVDDAEQGVTDVVRGADLLESTARQVLLQQALGLPPVRYLHLPLAVDRRGRKLSKSEEAPSAGREGSEARALLAALRFLAQSPPDELDRAAPAEILDWAGAHWRLHGFRGRASGEAPQAEAAGSSG